MNNAKVFISYSRKDQALAHLIAHVLRLNGIECLIDRDLRAGQRFDAQVQQMIRESTIVLVLLTKDASASQWVNQEIGFATAHGKTIWPIAADSDIEPSGMLSSTQTYSLLDWTNPSVTIERLVSALKSSAAESSDPYKKFGFDHVIEGKLERTRFLISRLRALRQERPKKLVILHQAAFSIFGASSEDKDLEPSHSREYMDLLLEERRALEELLELPECFFKLVLWPVRAFESRYMSIRFANLLKWMEGSLANANIDFVCAQYPGPNRLIVMGQFMLEGFKLHNHPGYEMSIVKYQPDSINDAAAVFHQTIGSSKGGKELACQQVRHMYEKLVTLPTEHVV